MPTRPRRDVRVSSPSVRPTRRQLLAAAAAGVAGLALGPRGRAAPVRAARAGASHPTSAALQAAFAHVEPGVHVHAGWSVAAVRLDGGAVVVELRHRSGRRARIDVCRAGRTAHGAPIERTRHMALHLMNDGAGGRRTPADLERAARVLAELLRRQETACPPELLTHAQREALIAAGALHCVPLPA